MGESALVTLRLDDGLLKEFCTLLDLQGEGFRNISPELTERIVNLAHPLFKTRQVHNDALPAAANELVIELEHTDLSLELFAALRAGNIKINAVGI